MNPRDIAARLTRPMSDEEAYRLLIDNYAGREVADTDPIMDAHLRAARERIERAERGDLKPSES